MEMKDVTDQAIRQTTLYVESATLELDEGRLTIRQSQKQFASQQLIKVQYLRVLWAQATTEQLTIHYAAERHKVLNAATRVFQLLDQDTSSSRVQAWVQLLLDRAYGASKPRKHLKIYLNPFSGNGSAVKLYHRYAEPLFEGARCHVELHETCYSGHASRSVREDRHIDSWDAIVCCSGDGLPYEVINGIAQRDDAGYILRNVPIVQLPGGSGNAMCVNMFKTTSFSHAALYTVKGIRQPIDLMSVTQGDKRYISFLSQNIGLLAECDLDTESMRFLGGKRFAVGFLRRLFNPPVYGCDLAVYNPASEHLTDPCAGRLGSQSQFDIVRPQSQLCGYNYTQICLSPSITLVYHRMTGDRPFLFHRTRLCLHPLDGSLHARSRQRADRQHTAVSNAAPRLDLKDFPYKALFDANNFHAIFTILLISQHEDRHPCHVGTLQHRL
ncbi:sphinganine kinase lcb4 [Penicillium ochrochloron]